jgi:hypothetical protein
VKRRLVALLERAGPAGVPVYELAAALGTTPKLVHCHAHQMNRIPRWPAVVGSGAGRARRGRLWLRKHAPKEPWRWPA